MNDKEIIQAMFDDENMDHIIMTDDDHDTFEMAQLGIIPLHGAVYGILDLISINGEPVSEEDSGLVILELEIDEETGDHYVTTVEDDELFEEIIEAYENLPEE